MVQKSLLNYIKGLIQKGYSISAIRDVLLKYGYTVKDFNDAINLIYHPTIRHEIHLSKTTIFVILFIFISLLGTASFFYFYSSQNAAELLDLNLDPIATKVEAGESVTFLKELSNLGSSKRYDVVIKQEIIDQKTLKAITEKTETRAIETFGSTQTNILVPQDAKPGDYVLRVMIEYADKKAVATLPVKIIEPTKKGNCFDGIKNQNEKNIDCGGGCRPCESQIAECNDNNLCTEDIIENGICVNKPLIDCKTGEKPSEVATETLDEIEELARTSPSNAMQKCNKIEVPDLKDTCISNIGKAQHNENYCSKIINARIKDLCYLDISMTVNDNSLCEKISASSRKDSCYMTFVIDNKDYSVCDKLNNTQLRLSCENLKQLHGMQQEQNQIQENQNQNI